MNVQNLLKSDSTQTFSGVTNDLLVGNAVNKYKTFDFGLNAKAGFEFGNIMLSGFYSRGLSNFYTASYTSTFHHKVVGVTLGIWLTKSATPAKKIINDTIKTVFQTIRIFAHWFLVLPNITDARFLIQTAMELMMNTIPVKPFQVLPNITDARFRYRRRWN